MDEIKLRYGVNPHQSPARAFVPDGKLPFKVLSGAPGYINLLDALNSWQLVREMRQLTELPSAASFKHASPSGVASGRPLSPELAESYFVTHDALSDRGLRGQLSPLAIAYVRARGADRMASFGDWIALSDKVDESTAKIISREVSDGCIAPGFEPAALALLKAKKNGTYPVLEIDPTYGPPETESRQVFGVTLEQARNNTLVTPALLEKVVTVKKQITDDGRIDMLVATLALKYTQSNSVCLAWDGQTIGIGAGQQSRIACSRIACAKADKWLLRLHPKVRGLDFKKGTTRTEKANAIDLYLEEGATEAELRAWRLSFNTVPDPLSRDERQAWLARIDGVALSSDAFIPFRDNIDRAARSGVRYVVQTGGSSRDEGIIRAADEYGMVMVFTGLRLFHH
jgi:phosphoribosylaminoimidazolecarboxamide formyltransferase/IMP cyclohydrolase